MNADRPTRSGGSKQSLGNEHRGTKRQRADEDHKEGEVDAEIKGEDDAGEIRPFKKPKAEADDHLPGSSRQLFSTFVVTPLLHASSRIGVALRRDAGIFANGVMSSLDQSVIADIKSQVADIKSQVLLIPAQDSSEEVGIASLHEVESEAEADLKAELESDRNV